MQTIDYKDVFFLPRRILTSCKSSSLFEILILMNFENILTDGIQKTTLINRGQLLFCLMLFKTRKQL